MRSQKETDDIVYKLQEVLNFYGKELEPQFRKVWLTAFAEWETARVMQSLDDYIGSEHGKYAPKPADIIKILKEKRERDQWGKKYSHDNFVDLDAVKCDEKTAKAWCTYMKFAFDFMVPGQKPDMPLNECLEIVNREAKKHNQPDSILLEHRIAEVWA